VVASSAVHGNGPRRKKDADHRSELMKRFSLSGLSCAILATSHCQKLETTKSCGKFFCRVESHWKCLEKNARCSSLGMRSRAGKKSRNFGQRASIARGLSGLRFPSILLESVSNSIAKYCQKSLADFTCFCTVWNVC
jgi:hypothetical protein